MVAIKNVVLAASAVASALAAPATTSKRQDWFGGSGMGAWGGQGQAQGQGQGNPWASWGQGGQGQGQAAGASTGAAPASTGAASSSAEVDHVPTTGDQSGAAAPSTGASTGASAGGNASDSSAAGSTGAAGTTSLAAVSGETITDNKSGQSGSYYFSHWHESSGATMTLGDGSYSLEWTEASGNVVSGIGWNPASAK